LWAPEDTIMAMLFTMIVPVAIIGGVGGVYSYGRAGIMGIL